MSREQSIENHRKGREYEIFINSFINNSNSISWIWDQIPEIELRKAKLINSHNELRLLRKNNNKINPLKDVGIDILEFKNNIYNLIQCKNYSNSVCISDLAGFYMRFANNTKNNIKGTVYYTSELSKNISNYHENINIKYIKFPMIIEKLEKIKFKLRNYQCEAVDSILKIFEKENTSILSMPCGTGKTLTSCEIGKNFKNVIIFSPLRQFAKQNLDRFIEYDNTKNLLIDSDNDGTRNINEILKYIKNNKKNRIIFSATYKSVDIVNKFIDKLDNTLIIIDEFHNLSNSNIFDEEDEFYKLINSNKKILYMSATPRIYDIENTFEDYVLSKIGYNMEFNYAIKNKLICDYKIYVPSIHEDINTFYDEIDKEINVDNLNIDLEDKIKYFFKCLIDHGSQKCIVYLKTINEINEFIKTFNELNNYYSLDYHIDSITCNDNYLLRHEKINIFETNDKRSILCSVQILDECIDIPICDSVFITYTSESKIRNIQRISRATRINNNDPNKIAKIFLWCNEYNQLTNVLSSLKEFDIDLVKKVKLQTTCLDENLEKNNKEKVEKDITSLEKLVIGVKEFKIIRWNEKLELLKQYIIENNKRPSTHNIDEEIKRLGQWYDDQNKNYNKNIKTMRIKENRIKWEEFNEKYKKYLISSDDKWLNNLQKVKDYININNKKPSISDEDDEIAYLGRWTSHQANNYNNRDRAMSHEDNRKLWDEFKIEYNKYILGNIKEYNNKEWLINYKKLIDYFEKYKKRPPREDTLYTWLIRQNNNYKKKIESMSNENNSKLWKKINNKYPTYFRSDNEKWYDNLELINQYIKENNKRPSDESKDKDIKYIGKWLGHQITNYKKKYQIMEEEEVRDVFKKFIYKNKVLFPNFDP